MPTPIRASSSDMFGKLLIVDDDPVVLAALKRYFSCNWLVSTACDGQDAFEELLSDAPDAIISDLDMPRVDGLKLAHAKNRSDLKDIPFFLITGTPLDVAEFRSSGITKVVRKPFDVSRLCRDVREAVATLRLQAFCK